MKTIFSPHILNADGSLGDIWEEIGNSIKYAHTYMKTLRFRKKVDVVLWAKPTSVLPETGIGAHAVDENTIIVFFDIENCARGKNLEKELIRTLLHEFHHCMRWQTPGYGSTLGEILISEGLADYFEEKLTGFKRRPWTDVLSKEEMENLKKIVKRHKYAQNIDFGRWFLGSNPDEIKRWAGYSLGYEVVRSYFEGNPSQNPLASFHILPEKFDLYL